MPVFKSVPVIPGRSRKRLILIDNVSGPPEKIRQNFINKEKISDLSDPDLLALWDQPAETVPGGAGDLPTAYADILLIRQPEAGLLSRMPWRRILNSHAAVLTISESPEGMQDLEVKRFFNALGIRFIRQLEDTPQKSILLFNYQQVACCGTLI